MARFVVGRLNGVDAPVGTIVGPRDTTGEYLVVVGRDERGVTCGYATVAELDAMNDPERDVCSLTEHKLFRGLGRPGAAKVSEAVGDAVDRGVARELLARVDGGSRRRRGRR